MSDYAIHSEARAGHWVAWVTSAGDSRPAGSVILPGQTQEEAESRTESIFDLTMVDRAIKRGCLGERQAREDNQNYEGCHQDSSEFLAHRDVLSLNLLCIRPLLN